MSDTSERECRILTRSVESDRHFSLAEIHPDERISATNLRPMASDKWG
jgi:hypothetical protein